MKDTAEKLRSKKSLLKQGIKSLVVWQSASVLSV